MNNKGQVLLLFVTLVPVFFILIAFITDITLIYIEKSKLDNINEIALTAYYTKTHNENKEEINQLENSENEQIILENDTKNDVTNQEENTDNNDIENVEDMTDVENMIKELVHKNSPSINIKRIETKDDTIYIELEIKIDSIFGKVIGFNEYKVVSKKMLEIIGDKYIIKRG